MANPEHLAKLNEGVNAWNKWRAENPDVKPDLTGADLGEAVLSKADDALMKAIRGILPKKPMLLEANLSEADLSKANLREADLRKADLSEANLSEANLSEANLTKANLTKANLSAANLTGANLSEADLSGAILNRANLTGANLEDTNITGVDLSQIDLRNVNLENAVFSKPVVFSRFTIKIDDNISFDDLRSLLNAIARLHELTGSGSPRIEQISIGHNLPEHTYREEWK